MTRLTAKFFLTSVGVMFAFEAQAQTMGYFLPKVTVGGVIVQRLEHCPTGEDDDIYPRIITKIAVKSTYTPEDYVEVSAKSGFLAQRSVAVNLREDGTLKSINASSEGQGAQVLGAVVKVAAGIAGLGGGGQPSFLKSTESSYKALQSNKEPTNPHLKCKPEIEAKITELLKLREEVAKIASKIANDRPILQRELEISEIQKTKIADLEDELTQKIKVKAFTPEPKRNVELQMF